MSRWADWFTMAPAEAAELLAASRAGGGAGATQGYWRHYNLGSTGGTG